MRKTTSKFLISILLVIISILLVSFLSLISFIYFTIRCLWKGEIKVLTKYYLDCAVSGDQTGNAFCAPLLNKTLIKKKVQGYLYGNMDETVSSAMGKNKQLDSNTKFAKFVGRILEKLDKNHLEKSIDQHA